MSKPGTYIWRYEIVLRDAKTIVNDKTPASAEVFKAFKDYLAGGSNGQRCWIWTLARS